MTNPQTVLEARLRAAIEAAFGSEGAGADPVIRRSDRADFQANGAMGLAKRLGQSPRDVAHALVSHLDLGVELLAPEVAGPGFINLTLTPEYLGAAVTEMAHSARLGVAPVSDPQRVMVEYSSPNVAKAMHVGHLRSTVIGDALARILDWAGHQVTRDNHLGDWGTQFGMLIEHLVDIGVAGDPSAFAVDDLDALYRDARAKFDTDDEFKVRARARVPALQQGDKEARALWQALINESERHFEEVYEKLGVLLVHDDIRGESFYNDLLDGVVEELQTKNVVVLDDGAWCAFPHGFVNRDGDRLALIVRKSDGGYGYAATDLAAIAWRVREAQLDRIVYVVDARQAQHFAMVFEVAREAGWLGDARVEHVAFGMVLGDDNKPFKTRAGDTVRLVDLLDEAVDRASKLVAEKSADLDPDSQARVAVAVGIGAVKYADLVADRTKDYVFDFDRLLAMDGNTAPYIQMAHVRIRSILRRAEEHAFLPGPIAVETPAERALALQLLAFEGVVHEVIDTLRPHTLCNYLFETASTFTTFYEQCPVLKADTSAQRGSRLALAEVSARVLAQGLSLLGIAAPDRM